MDYDIGASERVSGAVVRAVSAVDGREPVSLPPLTEVLDPDCLDALFEDRRGGEPRTGGHISFLYCGCRVAVENSEFLTVEPIDVRRRDSGDREPRCTDAR